MLIDIFASLFIVAIFPENVRFLVWVLFWPLIIGYWIYSLVRLGKNKSKGGMWAILAVGLFLSFFFACIASMFIGWYRERERERERERGKLAVWDWCLKLV